MENQEVKPRVIDSRTPEQKIRIWFVERFNRSPRIDVAYYEEWLHRFRTGKAWLYMDVDSRRIWTQLYGEN